MEECYCLAGLALPEPEVKGGLIMAIIRGLWRMFRGIALLVIICAIFTGVILVSCLARLFFGDGRSEAAGKLRLDQSKADAL